MKRLLLPLLALTTTTVFANQSAIERLEDLQNQREVQRNSIEKSKKSNFIDRIKTTERPLANKALRREITNALNYIINEDAAAKDLYTTHSSTPYTLLSFLYGSGNCFLVQNGDYDCKSGEEAYTDEQRDERVCYSLVFAVKKVLYRATESPEKDYSHQINIVKALNQNYKCM